MRKGHPETHGGAHLLLPFKGDLMELLGVPDEVVILKCPAQFLNRTGHIARFEFRDNQCLAREVREGEDGAGVGCGIGCHLAVSTFSERMAKFFRG